MEGTFELKLKECIQWIHSNNYSSIALQFSVSLLKYSAEVVKYLESKTGCDYNYFVIYSDTCSVDHLSPLHLGERAVDAIIRFGNVCLVPMPDTVSEFPVLFVFTFDTNDCCYEFVEKWLENQEDLSCCLILYDTSYTNLVKKLLQQNLVNNENIAKLNCYSTKWSFISESKDLVSTSTENRNTFGQFIIEKSLQNFKKLVFIGSELSLYYRVTNFEIINILNPLDKSVCNIIPSMELRKRMASIETVKSNRCRKIGVIYSNSYPSLNLEYIKRISAKRGKEVYFISLVQSTDECKMANFTDLSAFVIATNCYCSPLIDKIKLHIPIISLAEFEISCGIKCEYAGIHWPSDTETENIHQLSNQIVEVNVTDRQLWYGLEIQSENQQPSIVKEGQSGIASCYESEPCHEIVP